MEIYDPQSQHSYEELYDIPMKSGIYKISNIVNSKAYIGSSINLYERLRGHLYRLKEGKHRNRHLQQSFNKYGINSFIFEILELCEQNILIEREQYYIDLFDCYNNGYNIMKANISEPRSPYAKEMTSVGVKNWWKNMSEEKRNNVCKKITIQLRNGHKKWLETIKNMNDEERKTYSEQQRNSALKRYENMTYENWKLFCIQQKINALKSGETIKKKFKNLSKENKEILLTKVRQGHKKWIDNMTNNEKEIYYKKLKIGARNRIKNMNDEERKAYSEQQRNKALKRWNKI